MPETFGKMDVARGKSCTNSPWVEHWTTPCCYADVHDQATTQCPGCGAPIRCEIVSHPAAVCTIRDADGEDD